MAVLLHKTALVNSPMATTVVVNFEVKTPLCTDCATVCVNFDLFNPWCTSAPHRACSVVEKLGAAA